MRSAQLGCSSAVRTAQGCFSQFASRIDSRVEELQVSSSKCHKNRTWGIFSDASNCKRGQLSGLEIFTSTFSFYDLYQIDWMKKRFASIFSVCLAPGFSFYSQILVGHRSHTRTRQTCHHVSTISKAPCAPVDSPGRSLICLSVSGLAQITAHQHVHTPLQWKYGRVCSDGNTWKQPI